MKRFVFAFRCDMIIQQIIQREIFMETKFENRYTNTEQQYKEFYSFFILSRQYF